MPQIKIVKYISTGKIPGTLYHYYRKHINNLFSRLYSLANTPFPLAVELETVNRCNNNCSFCPVSRQADTRPLARMPIELIHKIADELKATDFSGNLDLFSNNEPLLDTRAVEICRLFNSEVPHAIKTIYTNGMLLNYKLYIELFESGLDNLVVDNYDDDLQLIKPVKETLRLVGESENKNMENFKSKTTILIRKKTDILTNRAGTAPNKHIEEFKFYHTYSKSPCVLPFIQFIIRPDGKISKCCQDALGQETLGDINKSTIKSIWNGENFNRLRTNLLRKGRYSENLCNKCDVSILRPGLLLKSISSKFPDIS